MKAFVVLAAIVAAASANPQVLLSNGLGINNLGLYGGAYTYGSPIAQQYVSSPLVSQQIIAPVATKTQYHAQDELGQASYGYAHAGQAHAAVRDAAGNVRGSYAYVNPEGKEVRVEYVADAGGFRVASNALPVGPVAGVAPQLVGPAQVVDTPEVIQARAAHLAAHAQARSRTKRGVVTHSVVPSALGYSSVLGHNTLAINNLGYSSIVPSTLGYSSVVPSAIGYSNVVGHNTVAINNLGYSAGLVSPVAYSTPVVAQNVREATLTKVVNTPGHAVSYRVD